MPKIRIDGHLIIPFACPKWEISSIKIVGVSTDATFLESETPCVYIDRNAKKPLTLQSFFDAWPIDDKPFETEDWHEALAAMHRITNDFGNLGTSAEHQFVDAYFAYLHELGEQQAEGATDWLKRFPSRDADYVFDALLPLPQAHLYVVDPMTEWYFTQSTESPKNMFKVDFAFWTGADIVAVEIDGGSHIGSQKHVRKDRMLQRAGVKVIHVLNDEIEQQPERVIHRLLPDDVADFWKRGLTYPSNPLRPLPF